MPNPIVKPGMMVYDIDKKVVGWVFGDMQEYTHGVRIWTIEWVGNRYGTWPEGHILKAHRDFKNLAKLYEQSSCRAGNNAI